MTLLVVGLSYRTAPVRLLEAATVEATELPKVLHELLRGGHVSEALVLSTCNRVEIYADVDRFHGGVQDASSVLARRIGLEVPALAEYLYVHYEDAAVLHLFSVAAGLDSMVLGETQIVGQLRSAYAAASEHDAIGRTLHDLCQQALRVAKRVRAETAIDQTGASVVSVALGEAERVLGSLAGRRALVVGAGSIGALAATSLRRAGVGEIMVANRSTARAERLAAALAGGADQPVGARAVALEGVPAELALADVVVTATGSVGLQICYDTVAAAMAARDDRPVVLLDLAMPHDVDRGVAALPGVHYVDIEALRGLPGASAAAADVARARDMLADEVTAVLAANRATAVAPTVAALRARAAEVVEAELIRLDGRLPGLEPAVRAEVAHAVHRVVQTLLHTPTVRIKQLAERPGGDSYALALRELFGLDPGAATLLSTMDVELANGEDNPVTGRLA